MKARLFFLIISLPLIINAQSKRGNSWVTGFSGNRIDFNNNTITTTQGVYFPFKYFTAGNSCISDTNGNLVLSSDSYNIYGVNGQFIEGGDTLIPLDFYLHDDGWSAYSQGSIILAVDSNKYYHVVPTFSDLRFNDCITNNNCHFDLLLYNVIDMNANGGLGKLTKRMQPMMQNANLRKTQMMACKHGNGKDWWLLKNEGDNADVHTFLFTQDSVYDKGVQTFTSPNWGPWDIRGQSTFNADGSKFATTSHGSSTGLIFIADFDRCHGFLSNPKTIQLPWNSQHNPNDTTWIERLSTGLAFSPNGKLLFISSGWNIYQYDLNDDTLLHIAGLDSTAFAQYETMYLAPDNRIYIGNFHGVTKQMSRIDNPDVKGVGCNFCPRCLRLDSLGANGYVGTPPCMPNYGLGAKTCWPLSSSEIGDVSSEMLVVYPNPISTSLTIELTTNRKGLVPLEIYNMVGELVLKTEIQSQTKVQINISALPKGLYVIRCEGVSQKVVVE